MSLLFEKTLSLASPLLSPLPPSWMVWSLLTSLEYTHTHPSVTSKLLTGFASQLVSCGKWHWAVFILLHLQDPVLTRAAVQDVLDHNCCSNEELSSGEFFVVEKLKVPKAWVYEAKALRASQEGWYDLKALHLLSAGQWNSAHVTIMEHLAVDDIINGMTTTTHLIHPPPPPTHIPIHQCTHISTHPSTCICLPHAMIKLPVCRRHG